MNVECPPYLLECITVKMLSDVCYDMFHMVSSRSHITIPQIGLTAVFAKRVLNKALSSNWTGPIMKLCDYHSKHQVNCAFQLVRFGSTYM